MAVKTYLRNNSRKFIIKGTNIENGINNMVDKIEKDIFEYFDNYKIFECEYNFIVDDAEFCLLIGRDYRYKNSVQLYCARRILFDCDESTYRIWVFLDDVQCDFENKKVCGDTIQTKVIECANLLDDYIEEDFYSRCNNNFNNTGIN